MKKYTLKQFNRIYSNAYAVVIKGFIYEIFDSYENEQGELVTVFKPSDSEDGIIEVHPTIEEGGVEYDEKSQKFHFINDEKEDIGWFRLLVVATLEK